MNRTFILACFKIKEETILSYDDYYNEEDNVYHFFIMFKKTTKFCPHCGSISFYSKGYYDVKINTSVIKHTKCVGNIRNRRFFCKDCNKNFKEANEFYNDYSTIANIVKKSIIEDLKERRPYLSIAKDYGVSVTEVIKIFDSLPNIDRLMLPSVMCVDEFHFTKDINKDPRYPFVISNPYTSEIIDIVEYRTKNVLSAYFSQISSFERKNVRFFISDMNPTFREIKKIFFKDAIHIIDHFHIIKSFNDAINNERRCLLSKYKEDKSSPLYQSLKNNWKLFLMNQSKLKKLITSDEKGITYDLYITVLETFRTFNTLGEIYYAREEFTSQMVKMRSYQETEEFFNYFTNKLDSCIAKPLQKLNKTLKKWKKEIISAYAKNETGFYLTNAVAEANNNTIQTYINISSGLTNFQRFRKRILYINRNKRRGQ